MDMFRKDWTPAEAEEWTKEDTAAVIISPIIYVAVMIGGAMSALLMPLGFVILGAGLVLMLVMIRLINPKLSAVSRGYEEKQKHYIEELEKKVKWEE